MKHGRGIKDLDDKSIGMEILMTESFAKINPTDPLILGKQAVRRKRPEFHLYVYYESLKRELKTCCLL